MSTRNQRIGLIIRTIACNPGITLSGLLKSVHDHGIDITERTLAKDIGLLKDEYQLLTQRPRLRQGYVLQGIYSLGEEELDTVVDALNAFGTSLESQSAQETVERLKSQAQGVRRSTKSSTVRVIGHRQIYALKDEQKKAERDLAIAAQKHAAIQATYKTPREAKPIDIKGYPLFLVFYERGWYCIIKDMNEKAFRPRRLDRFHNLKILNSEPSNASHETDTQEARLLMSHGWGMSFPRSFAELNKSDHTEVVVRFDSTLASYILEGQSRHPLAKTSRAKDGSGDVEFRIKLHGDLFEFKNWVRSFGSKAWFLSPQNIVETEKREVRRMAERYKV